MVGDGGGILNTKFEIKGKRTFFNLRNLIGFNEFMYHRIDKKLCFDVLYF